MVERIPFHSRTKGALAEMEDWWALVVQDDGSQFVEHEWSHVNAYGRSKYDSSGTRLIPVEEFLAGEHDGSAKERIEKLLAARAASRATD